MSLPETEAESSPGITLDPEIAVGGKCPLRNLPGGGSPKPRLLLLFRIGSILVVLWFNTDNGSSFLPFLEP